MRFLNKFYSFIKSIYLNNSKYSNNLRHALRIFFEREVKTKHTPMLFGSTFKGSKWTDYQTFNINKLLIKSGLYYFYYIIFAFSITFLLLGRSKSEQYFGFLPFFTVLNFVLGYIPIVLSDTVSQIIIITYSLYLSIHKLFFSFSNKLLRTSLLSFDKQDTASTYSSFTSSRSFTNPNNHSTNYSNLFTKVGGNNTKLISNSILSKNISKTQKSIYGLQTSNSIWNIQLHNTLPINNFGYIFKVKNADSILNTISDSASSITSSEATYNYTNLNINTSIHYESMNLKDVLARTTVKHYPTQFNFNLQKNLNISNQQRWLTKNSLLSESIVNNSFLITQLKKLVSSGSLNSQLTNNSLWLPSQASKLSTMESYVYLNNLSNKFNTSDTFTSFLKNNKNITPSFDNLNFFENSRLFLVKKYFFTNNISNNLVLNTNKNLSTLLKPSTTQNITSLNLTLNTYKTSISFFIQNPTTPSLATLVEHSNNNLHLNKSTNFLNLSTASLDLLNSNTNFYFLLTSNLNSLNTTKYFDYASSTNTVSTNKSDVSNNLKFFKL